MNHITTASTDEIKNLVGKVRAGKDLTPDKWPDGAPVAVALSFDVDTETIALWNKRHSPSAFSRGEFGARVAMPRILKTLHHYQIPATFFIPAVSAVLHEDLVPAIQAAGVHEIGMHGWIHESIVDIPADDERELTLKTFDFWCEQLQKPPVGIRTPSWDFSEVTLSIINEIGLIYDSSLMADDRPYEILDRDRPTGLIELPVDWKLDDYMYFQIDYERGYHPYIGPDEVFDIWRAEFDGACEEGTTFILTMHPQIIGHRSRMPLLNRLIEHMQSRRAWITTLEKMSTYLQND
jgi:peptidoglycan/xylan/chitin deacetylase (PgdA/CDA1 family)